MPLTLPASSGSDTFDENAEECVRRVGISVASIGDAVDDQHATV